MRRSSQLLQLALALSSTLISPALVLGQTTAPTVKLDEATVVGLTNGSVTTFSGIPYAEAPIGDLRLRLPKPITYYNGTINATQVATQCIQLGIPIRSDLPQQMAQDLISFLGLVNPPLPPAPEGEDCLNINVQVPAGTQPNAKLPVLVFIYGGGFSIGSSAQIPGASIIQRSVELGQPIIYVAMNYRLHTFGFLGGEQVKEAGVGNLGLHDQRVSLRWIQKYIAAFGGDPEKVTIWGTSAGAWSIGLHMLTNGGDDEGLFHGAIMDAGFPLPTGDISDVQLAYDTVVQHSGCANANDTLDCLRQIPADNLTAAAANVPNLFEYPGAFHYPWLPRADGVFLTDAPQHLLLSGNVSSVPFIAGDALDEGATFATGAFNISTEEEFSGFIHQSFFPKASEAEIAYLLDLYPNDPALGSPFGTGDANQLAPMYKRTAAFLGDFIFQAPRRLLLEERSGKQPAWSYISSRGAVPGMGAGHGSDFLFTVEGGELLDYVLRFTATFNPNGASNRTIDWPNYDTVSRTVLTVVDGEKPLGIGNDTQRLDAIADVTELSIAYPL